MDTKIRVTDKPHQSKTLKTGLATALLVALMALTACAPMTPVPAPDAVMQATPAPAEEVAATPAPTEAAVTEPAGAFGDAWEPVSCDTFTLPKDVAELSDCGYVTVPELHEDPDGRAIKLAVVRIHSTGENPTPDPLFMEQGGPGGSTVGLFPKLLLSTPAVLRFSARAIWSWSNSAARAFPSPTSKCPKRSPAMWRC